jgi:hypothetical protein
MKTTILLPIIILALFSCSKEESKSSSCGTHNGKELYKGPEGGCFYYNSSGHKTYVPPAECDC